MNSNNLKFSEKELIVLLAKYSRDAYVKEYDEHNSNNLDDTVEEDLTEIVDKYYSKLVEKYGEEVLDDINMMNNNDPTGMYGGTTEQGNWTISKYFNFFNDERYEFPDIKIKIIMKYNNETDDLITWAALYIDREEKDFSDYL